MTPIPAIRLPLRRDHPGAQFRKLPARIHGRDRPAHPGDTAICLSDAGRKARHVAAAGVSPAADRPSGSAGTTRKDGLHRLTGVPVTRDAAGTDG